MVHPPPDQSELRAKDLLRRDELLLRTPVGSPTTFRLLERLYRRPAGSSARLWRKMGAEDPFAPPPEHSPPAHRAVYAAGRFVRIDQAGSLDPADQIRAAAARQQEKAASPRSKTAPDPVHTPSFGNRPDNPMARGKPQMRKTLAPEDRAPPIIASATQDAVTRAGRFRAAPTRRESEAPTPPASKPATPAPKPAPPVPKPATPVPKPAPPAQKAPPAVAPQPAKVLPPTPSGLPPGAINVPGPAEVVPLRKPTKVEEPPSQVADTSGIAPPVNRTPPKPGAGGSLDDLFGGGGNEGRVRIGPTRKKTEQKP